MKRIILFLLLNFGALAIGGLFTSKGVSTEWYTNLLKAPWTPPSWMFGAAWTFIMVCYSFFMSAAWNSVSTKFTFIVLYGLQWILNVLWNPLFFKYHETTLSLIDIFLLTLLIASLVKLYSKQLKYKVILLLPYFIWLLIATSLNLYITIYN